MKDKWKYHIYSFNFIIWKDKFLKKNNIKSLHFDKVKEYCNQNLSRFSKDHMVSSMTLYALILLHKIGRLKENITAWSCSNTSILNGNPNVVLGEVILTTTYLILTIILCSKYCQTCSIHYSTFFCSYYVKS